MTKTRRTSTSKPRTSSSRKTTKPKKDEEEKKPTPRRKTSTSKHETEKTKPKSSESKRETTKTKPKSSTAKHKDGETTSAAKEPKSTAKKPKSTTSKRKATKKESGKETTRKRKEGLADLVGELLARRAAGDKGKESVLGPILEHLTKNMGLSSDTAQAVVGYVLEKLQRGRQEKAAASAPGSGEPGAAADQEFSLDGLLQQTRSGPAVEVVPSASGDEVEELARDLELDPATAEASLRQVLEMLGLPGL